MHFAPKECKRVIENVKPYYNLLIPAQLLERHLFWANFKIEHKDFKKDKIRTAQIPDLEKLHGYNLTKYKLSNKRQILRNVVLPEIGNHIMQNLIESLNKH